MHEKEEGKEIIYTKEQSELIRSEIQPRRKIKGVAGCGKTLILAKRAVNAHIRTGQKVLILTYNISLKNYIHDRISDVRADFYWSNFYITNYHQFFKTQANNYNLEITGIENWEDMNFFEDVTNSIIKFDVVLIDEIQDYQQSWIDIITKYFTHSETEFVVFGDEKQNIYNRELNENREIIVRQIPGGWNRSLNKTKRKNPSFRMGSYIYILAIAFQIEFMIKKYNLEFEPKDASQLKSEVQTMADFERRIIEYHSFETYNAQELYEIVYEVLERNEIHSSDSGILCSKVELLREMDFLIRTKKKERTATTFESQEEYEEIQDSKEAIKKLRRAKKVTTQVV